MYQNRTNAITINLLFLVNSYKLHGHFSLKIPQHFINGVSILDDTCTNHFLRNFLINSNKFVIKAKVKMVSTLPKHYFFNVWTVPNIFLFIVHSYFSYYVLVRYSKL